MKIIGVIPSRWESSRFPGKPLAMINGKPMLTWVYERACQVKSIDEVIVATDDVRIVEMCNENGINVMMTSNKHRTGADRVAEVAEKTDGDIYLNIQGDEPLIQPEAIQQIIDKLIKDLSVEYVGLRSRINTLEELENPNVVKAVTDLEGNAMYFSRQTIPFNKSLSHVYRVMGLYGYRREFLLEFKAYGQSGLEIAENGVEMLRAMEHGRKINLLDTDYVSIGVDIPADLVKVEEIMKKEREYVNEN